MPLLCQYDLGRGTLTLVQALAYPAHPAIRPDYEARLRAMMEAQTQKTRIWYESGDDVEVAVYDQSDGTFRLGEYRYPVQLPFGILVKCVVSGNTALWCHSEDGEVLSIDRSTDTVQGVGNITFTLAKSGISQDFTRDFDQNPVQTIPV